MKQIVWSRREVLSIMLLCTGFLCAAASQEFRPEQAAAEDRVQFQQVVENQLNALKERIDALKPEFELASVKARAEVDRLQGVLQWKAEAARQKWEVLKVAGAEAWSDLKADMQETLADLQRSFDEARVRLREVEPG